MNIARLICVTLAVSLCACGAKKAEQPAAAPTEATKAASAAAPDAPEAPGADQATEAKAPKHSVKPRPDEPPELPDGLYEGSLTGPLKGPITLKIVAGKVEEATANVGELKVTLKGKVSARRVSMGGRVDKDFLRLMGHGSEARMSGSWMAEVSGETHRGSWSADRRIVADAPE